MGTTARNICRNSQVMNNRVKPPRLIDWLIGRLCSDHYLEEVLGDLDELFQRNVETIGAWKAGWLYFFDAFFMIRPYLLKTQYKTNNTMMFQHYFRTFYRNLLREKTYATFNLIGLTSGIAIFFLSVLYVNHELGFDQFHKKADNIYRVQQKFNDGGQTANTSLPIGPALKADYPQVLNMARFNRIWQTRVIADNDRYVEQDILMAEPEIFEMLDFEFLRGSPSALSGPKDILITDQIAEKYYGDENPIGKTLEFPSFPDDFNNFKIAGVIKSYPTNSHLQFSMIGHIDARSYFLEQWQNVWASPVAYTFVEIEDKEFAQHIIDTRLSEFVERHFTRDVGEGAYLPVIPLKDIHLHSEAYYEFRSNNSEKYVYMVASIGTLILLLAAINFINLSTARSVTRAKEVGVRKVLGAQKSWLIKQFLVESLMVTFIAVVLAVGLAEAVLPFANDVLEVNISTDYLGYPSPILILAIIWVSVGTLAGIYPAFVLSSFKPVRVLKGSVENVRSKLPLRKILIVTQLSIVTILIVSIITIDAQLNYMLDKDVGFDKDNMVFFRMPDSLVDNLNRQEALKFDLTSNPNIKSVSSSWGMPGGNNASYAYRNFRYEDMPEGTRIGGGLMMGDHNFVDNMGIRLKDGRMFSKALVTDTASCIINEATAKAFGWTENAIGKELEVVGFNEYKVIGVVKDFNFEDLRSEVHPMVIALDPDDRYFRLAVRIQGDIAEAIPFIEKTLEKYADGWPQEINRLDNSVLMQYQSETQLSKMVRFLTFLAIVIAILGILGLSSYMVSKRIKEVGIRKVLGASVTKILVLLSKDYVILGVIASLIGIPIAWMAVNEWLGEFAYRISFNVLYVILAIILLMVITLATISVHTLKAATANPVKSLRYE